MLTFPRSGDWSTQCAAGLIAAIATAAAPLPAQPIADTTDPADWPVIELTADDTVIDRSVRIRIPEGTVIEDTNSNGVLQIVRPGITVEFEDGSELIGSSGPQTWNQTGQGAWDELSGVGIVIAGVENVTVRNATIRGYRTGLFATNADGLTLEGITLTDLYRARLASTPQREVLVDWLSPHDNDNGEWVQRYAAAIAIDRSDALTLSGLHVRRAQNGLILDRVNHSHVYDSDLSFLSGWGIAMWRASNNVISRNALDYNIRGHVEGVYNRGQDSAGLLMFEQCNDNIIAENSMTRCGDGVFAFAGREALGQSEPAEGREINYRDVGVNGNSFLRNDLSYASAHGLELTFSERNLIAKNRFHQNAICGIWGGYSSDTRVHDNRFSENGGMPYGAERGAINTEHASGWLIDQNTFENDRVAYHLWWDDDPALLALPGVRLDYAGLDGNAFVRNRVVITSDHPFGEGADLYGVHARRVVSDADRGALPFGQNWMIENLFEIDPEVGERLREDRAEMIEPLDSPERFVQFEFSEAELTPEIFGECEPVGKREHLGGRESIIMGEWGPWEFEQPLFRMAESEADRRVWELFVPHGAEQPIIESLAGPEPKVVRRGNSLLDPYQLTLEAPEGDEQVAVAAFRIRVGDLFERTALAVLLRTEWVVKVWQHEADPLTQTEAWRAEQGNATTTTANAINFGFGYAGPNAFLEGVAIESGDRFSIAASTQVVLPEGRWRIGTLSDDGIRLKLNGATVIERWDIHGPTPDVHLFQSDGQSPIELELEYFENDGYAALVVELSPI